MKHRAVVDRGERRRAKVPDVLVDQIEDVVDRLRGEYLDVGDFARLDALPTRRARRREFRVLISPSAGPRARPGAAAGSGSGAGSAAAAAAAAAAAVELSPAAPVIPLPAVAVRAAANSPPPPAAAAALLPPLPLALEVPLLLVLPDLLRRAVLPLQLSSVHELDPPLRVLGLLRLPSRAVAAGGVFSSSSRGVIVGRGGGGGGADGHGPTRDAMRAGRFVVATMASTKTRRERRGDHDAEARGDDAEAREARRRRARRGAASRRERARRRRRGRRGRRRRRRHHRRRRDYIFIDAAPSIDPIGGPRARVPPRARSPLRRSRSRRPLARLARVVPHSPPRGAQRARTRATTRGRGRESVGAGSARFPRLGFIVSVISLTNTDLYARGVERRATGG